MIRDRKNRQEGEERGERKKTLMEKRLERKKTQKIREGRERDERRKRKDWMREAS